MCVFNIYTMNSTLQGYVSFCMHNMRHAKNPSSSAELAEAIYKESNIQLDIKNLGMALSLLDAKAKNAKGKPNYNGYPTKIRKFFVTYSQDNGNLVYDQTKIDQRKLKARQTFARNQKIKEIQHINEVRTNVYSSLYKKYMNSKVAA